MWLECPLALVGLSCPTCGLGRSLMALARGDLEASLAFHPFTIPLVIVTALFLWLKPRRRVVIAFALLYAIWGWGFRPPLPRTSSTSLPGAIAERIGLR